MTTPSSLMKTRRYRTGSALRAVDGFAYTYDEDPARSYQLFLTTQPFTRSIKENLSKEAQRLDDGRICRRIGRMTEPELRAETLWRAEWYVNDVVGHFDKRVIGLRPPSCPLIAPSSIRPTSFRAWPT